MGNTGNRCEKNSFRQKKCAENKPLNLNVILDKYQRSIILFRKRPPCHLLDGGMRRDAS